MAEIARVFSQAGILLQVGLDIGVRHQELVEIAQRHVTPASVRRISGGRGMGGSWCRGSGCPARSTELLHAANCLRPGTLGLGGLYSVIVGSTRRQVTQINTMGGAAPTCFGGLVQIVGVSAVFQDGAGVNIGRPGNGGGGGLGGFNYRPMDDLHLLRFLGVFRLVVFVLIPVLLRTAACLGASSKAQGQTNRDRGKLISHGHTPFASAYLLTKTTLNEMLTGGGRWSGRQSSGAPEQLQAHTALLKLRKWQSIVKSWIEGIQSKLAEWRAVEIVTNFGRHDMLALVYIWRRGVSVPVLPSRHSHSKCEVCSQSLILHSGGKNAYGIHEQKSGTGDARTP